MCRHEPQQHIAVNHSRALQSIINVNPEKLVWKTYKNFLTSSLILSVGKTF